MLELTHPVRLLIRTLLVGLCLWSLAAPGVRAEPLITAVGEEQAGLAAARAHLPEDTDLDAIQPISVVELLTGRPPVVLSGGRSATCAGRPVSNQELATLAADSEDDYWYQRVEGATDRLAALESAGVCLTERVDPATLARAWFVRGVLATQRKDRKTAYDSFRRALFFQPQLKWDPDFPPDGRELFQAATDAVQSEPTAALEIRPRGAVAEISVDGQVYAVEEQPLALQAGRHLVQLGAGPVLSLAVDTPSGGHTLLLVPSAFATADLSWMEDEAWRADFAALLGLILGGEQPVLVDQRGRTWIGQSGAAPWTSVGAPRRDQPGLLGRPWFWLTAAGALVAGTGVAAAVTTANPREPAAPDPDQGTIVVGPLP